MQSKIALRARPESTLCNRTRSRERRSQRLPQDILSSLELQQRAKDTVEISPGKFFNRNPRRVMTTSIKEHRVRPSLERLHLTFEECTDDIHTIHLLIRNQLEILHPTIERDSVSATSPSKIW